VSNGVFAPVSFGLAAAAAWGAGDFTGGLATKRANVYGVVITSQAIGLGVILVAALLRGEPVPPTGDLILAGLSGLFGGFGLILLYRALAGGQMSVAAPISAVLAAAIPVLVSALWQGLPDPLVLAGLLLALLAIWLIARGEGGDQPVGLRLEHIRWPFLAGIAFGLFFILIHQASQSSLFWPIVATRLASMAFVTAFASLTHQAWAPPRALWPTIALCGLLDTAGNGLFVLSGQLGRMDVAVVLSSLYPAATVTLAWLLLKERIARPQMVGILSALIAIVLITI
jgi:drug/metabolite transporter (DMT)-like permease